MSDDNERKLYQLKIWLPGIKPQIWRRIRIQSDCTLKQLHGVIIAVMEWGGGHNWQFGDIGEELDKHLKLSDVFKNVKDEILFIYDYGDHWEHIIKFEGIIKRPRGLGVRYPICVAGRQASPPDNTGGLPGYKEMKKALKDPAHTEHTHLWNWVRQFGYENRFQPDYKFNPKSVLNPW